MTDKQLELLAPLNREWAMIDSDSNTILETFIGEEDALMRLEHFRARGRGKCYRIQAITWMPATAEITDAMRAMDAWIKGDPPIANAKVVAPPPQDSDSK